MNKYATTYNGVMDAMAATNTKTPREARLALQQATGKRYSYKPHRGAKQAAKAARRAEKELRAFTKSDETPPSSSPSSTA